MAAPLLPNGVHLTTVRQGTTLVRVHWSANGPIWFGPAPGKLATGRWDAPAGEYRTMYAGLSLTAAFAETVLHRPLRRQIARAELMGRSWTMIEVSRDLHLAQFHGPGLLKHGLSLGAVSSESYSVTQRIALEVHTLDATADGVLYRSSHDDDHLCVALFHDRVLEGRDLRVGDSIGFAEWGQDNWIPLLEEHGAILEPNRPLPSTDDAILEERRHAGEPIPRRTQ